ncbi:hypothetical protein DFH11DRAFT_876649 [Phellopilus nigrolimitatus]|nr:hypothetical protein DFH11DRAFT_876649 [Phellopilus nigrolimitatus]
MESLFDVRCIIEVKIGMGLGNKDIILELPVTIIHPAAMKGLPPSPERLVTSPAPHPRVVSPPPMSFPAYTSQRPVEAFDANYMNPPMSPPVYFAHSQSPPPLLHPIQPAYNQYYYYLPPPVAPYARPSSADPFAAQQLPVLPNQNQAIAVPYVNTDVVAGEHPQDPLTEGEPGKGERASRISAHLRMSSRNRSVSPQSHRFPQATSSVVATEDSPVTPQIRSAHTLHLTPVSGAGGIGTSPDSKAGLLSPRPVLSHKQSFDHGTVKSERVVDLERMAAEEVASKEKNDSRDKSLPRQPPHSEIQTPDTPRLPPEPTLAPIATRLRPDIWNREGGLEALERKLLEQVGTRKHEPERRPDVRSVLPHPITIPSSNMHRSDPFNDSAISSLALGADGPFANSRSPPPTALKESFFSPPSPLSEILDDRKSAEKDSRGKVKGREKQSEVHQLRKAATGRVAAWLGGIDPAIPPPPSDTPATSSPKTPAEDILPALDLDPHPLLRSPSILPAIESAPDMSPAIPTRSSGFILHTAKDTPSSFEPPKSDEEECPRAKTPTQSHPPPADPPGLTTPTKAEPPPIKPVLRRFADLPALPQPPGVKYDIRSARGGRGGKVASVATLWASLTSQQEVDTPSFPPHAKAGAFSPTFKKLRIPDLPGKPVVPSRSPPYNRKQHEAANPHLAELTNRRAKMTKSSSVPAVVSSSLATPVLSSTASLARPLRTSHPKYPYPQSNATASIPEAPLHSARHPTPKSVASGDHAFGQARLKDLIKKYQQGFGQ